MGDKEKKKKQRETERKRLSKSKSIPVDAVNNLEKWVNSHGSTASIAKLKVQLGQLESHYNRYVQLQEQTLDYVESEDEEDVTSGFINFESSYVDVKSQITALMDERLELSKPKEVSDTTVMNQSIVVATKAVRLPKLEPPKFSGAYSDWIDFKNEFHSMIIEDSELTDVDRFRFLRSCLSGPAKRAISKMESSQANFKAAWKALTTRYENTSLIFQSHINDIIQMQSVHKESAESVRGMVDQVSAHYRALKSLGSNVELAENFMICLMLSKLDARTVEKWEETTTREIPTWDGFHSFLEKRSMTLEKLEYNKRQSNKLKSTTTRNSIESSKVHAAFTTSSSSSCAKCLSVDHILAKCPLLIELSPLDRYQEIKRLDLCVLCLEAKHSPRFCRAKRCSKCNKRHHTMVHFESSTSDTPIASTSNPNAEVLVAKGFDEEPAILATAIINVFDLNGLPVPCRAVLDSGATTNFVSERFVQTLNLRKQKSNLTVGGIGAISTTSKATCFITISSRLESTKKFEICAAVLAKISGTHPAVSFSTAGLVIPSNLQLADPYFFKSQKIDLLIGAGLFWHLILPGQIKLGENMPILQETKFGWIIGGPLSSTIQNKSTSLYCNASPTMMSSEVSLNELVQRFWEIETFPIVEMEMNAKDQECEDHYALHTRRNFDGSYGVRLPFSKNPSVLGESMGIAMKRFLNLERRLDRMPEAKEMYVAFINEYEQLRHLEIVRDFDSTVPHYFLPHHHVMKMSSSSTKLRVVFDGSCKTSSGVSLNEILHSGPKLQDDLFIILLRFRLFEYVLTADIQKMYRQVRLELPDSNFQLILWRNNKNEPIKILRLCTVTYGTAAGSYLAIKTLNRLADDEKNEFPTGAQIIRKNFYVDDMMVGSNSLSKLKEIMDESVAILKKGGFTLSKFCSNNESILSSVEMHHREKYLRIDEQDVIKTLGLIWQPDQDSFRYTYQLKESTTPITKRVVLSEMASLFDPLGLVCPVITLAKIFYQDLWKTKFDWDHPLESEFASKWFNFRAQMTALKQICIPRFALRNSNPKLIEVHSFSDASEKAYGACVYLRCLHDDDTISCRLVCAKSKVAPTKTISIARLELLAAKLMTDLVARLKRDVFVELNVNKYFYWTDSIITLCWINAEPHHWNIFVAHRVTKIQQETQMGVWRHVPGKLNPADLISRGMLPAEIADSEFWFGGPTFLRSDESFWPSIYTPPSTTDDMAEKRIVKFALSTEIIEDIASSMHYCLDFRGIRRSFAYVLRFIQQCRYPKLDKATRKKLLNKKVLSLYSQVISPTIEDEENAELRFLRNIQQSHFSEEYNLLKSDRVVSSNSRLKSLAPFIDEFDMIRVGGRLKKANIPYDAKHQILLPRDHDYTKALIRYFHIFRTFHAGPHIVLTAIRKRYWPINGLVKARSIIRECIRCFRMRPKFISQIMGNLPEARINYKNVRPFQVSGVDFAGPLSVRHHTRCKVPKKVYVAVFICFTTKAVHLELAIDLSTETFIRCLKRFIADRGMVRKIYSDNATNFKGTANQLLDVKTMLENHKDDIWQACAQVSVEWGFIPPRSPNFGGLWEASVKIAKRLIRNVVGCDEITVDELHTVIRQVAAIINSRPITPISADPNDFEPLTPGHFLYGGPISGLPELPVAENINRVKMYQKISWMIQQFWRRFSTEYLGTLQARTKWLAKQGNISVGTLVLVKDDTLPPLKWKLGRVEECKPDQDGNVRVVVIRCADKKIERSISGIAILPIENDEANDC